MRIRASIVKLDERTLVCADSDLVIEAWPRSGNSFAMVAFLSAQQGEVKVAHHAHAPAQALRAAELDIPMLLIVREPADAVCSFLLMDSDLDPQRALQWWIDYHHQILFRSQLRPFAVKYSDVITDFGQVIRGLNQFYGTEFAEFEHTEANVRQCFEKIEARDRTRNAKRGLGYTVDEMTVSRPSADRSRRTDEVMASIHQCPALLESAEGLYRKIIQLYTK